MHTSPPAGRILRWHEVKALVGRSRSQVWRDEQIGTFPCRVRIGPNAVGWHEAEIFSWLSTRPRANAPRLDGWDNAEGAE